MMRLSSTMLMMMVSGGAFAQTPAGPQQNPIMSFVPFVLVFVVFYFLMIKPQKKRLQEEQAMMTALGKGDEVFLKSGMLGTVSGMTEKLVTLEISDGVKVKVLKSQIGGLAKKIFEAKEKKPEKK
jgi:preprotein translocase subunit YajC